METPLDHVPVHNERRAYTALKRGVAAVLVIIAVAAILYSVGVYLIAVALWMLAYNWATS